MRRFSDSRLLVATHNPGKLEEIADLLDDYGISVIGAAEMGLPEPLETGTTFVENARLKAHAASNASGLPALADDSGIQIQALGDAPGVYTADWAETGNGRDFVHAMTRAHNELLACGSERPWRAAFCCTFVLAWPDGHDEVFEGRVDGEFVWPMRGSLGHGYDPVFLPDGYDLTFGEMDRWEKNRISHRADAFGKLKAAFEDG
jgi:XTP/dITP diphosphohydrolase